MKSLRLTVILFVALTNLFVFGVGLAWLTRSLSETRREQESAFTDLLVDWLQNLIDERGLQAAGILRWSQWSRFEDAVVVSLPVGDPARQVGPQGVVLNPLGSRHRTPDFDWDQVLRGIRTSVAEDRSVDVNGGTAVPVLGPRGAAWGGCWFDLRPTWTTASLVTQLLPWFVISTLLLTLATVFVLRRSVLEPVELLARGSRRIAAGDLTVRLPEPERRDEIAELVRGFNRMAGEVHGFGERLEHEVEAATDKARRAEAAAMTHRRLAATGELAAGIAHEINNPLGGMINAVEVLGRQGTDEDKRRRYLELLTHGLERIRIIVGRVLRLAPRAATTETVDLAHPLGDAIGLMRHRLLQEGVELILVSRGVESSATEATALELLSGLPSVQGSAGELGQVALNLIANSLDALLSGTGKEGEAGAAAGGGIIRVAIEPRGDELLWRFEDNGPGLEAEALSRAADAFFTTKEAGKGTGLGLAIVHNVVTAHGGRVELSSEAGSGFRVDIWLPVHGAEA